MWGQSGTIIPLIAAVVFASCAIEEVAAKVCVYHDSLNQVTSIRCEQDCCGDYHIQYCCTLSTVSIIGPVVLGSVLLVCICVIATCYCCARRYRLQYTPIPDTTGPQFPCG